MRTQTDRNTNSLLIKLTFAFACFPALCFANAGSPMMVVGFVHLLLLNFFIGVAESYVIKKFQLPNRMWLIIIANYISAGVGMCLIAPFFSTLSGNDIFWWGGKTEVDYPYHLTGFFVGMLTSFVATLIIEYPVFILALKDNAQKSKLPYPFFIANLITNLIMTLVYFIIIVTEKH